MGTEVVTPPVGSSAPPGMGPAAFFGMAGSIFGAILGGRALFGRSNDEYGIYNRNWERATGFASPAGRAVLCLLGLIIPAIAAPIFVGIITACAIYYNVKAGMSIYRAYKSDNEASRRLNKANIKGDLIRAGIATALAILTIALFASPIGAAAALGLTVVSYVVSASYAIYSLLNYVYQMRSAKQAPTHELPDHTEQNVNNDENTITKAQLITYSQKSKLDFYYRVGRKNVLSQIAHQDNADEYLITEIATKIAALNGQIANRSGLFASVEEQKRIAKRDILTELQSFLEHLKAHPQAYAGDPIDAFRTFATTPHFDHRLEQDLGMSATDFNKKMRHSRQSFFAHVGDVEDIMEAFYVHFRYRSGHHYATGHNPRQQQPAPAYQPAVFNQPPPPAYIPPQQGPLYQPLPQEQPDANYYEQPPQVYGNGIPGF